MQLSILLLLAITTASFASAQQAALNGPVEGYLYDGPTRSLRAVIGVPGSATFGPSLSDGLDLASVAPHRNYAIGFQAGNCLLLSGLDSAAATHSVLSGIAAQPDDIVWSADGSLALLYSGSGNWIQTVIGFPGAPRLGTYLDVSALGGSLSAVATDSQGTRIAIAIEGAAGGVYLTSDRQSFVPVLGSSNVVALSFSPDGNTLYALDPRQPQLAAVDLRTSSFQTLPLEGLAEPLSVRPAQDAQGRSILYVASGRDQTLRIIDLLSRQVLSDVPMSVPPSEMDVLGRNTFLLTSRSRGDEPVWLFASTPQPAVYFIPAIRTDLAPRPPRFPGGRSREIYAERGVR
jgi:hypothetical protein